MISPFCTCLAASVRIMGRRGRNMRRPKPDGGRQNYSLALAENEQFEKYYKMQNIVPEGEWDDFMKTLRTDLPTTFRITGCKSEAKELLKKIKSDYFSNLTNFELEDGTVYEGTPKCLEWYPQDMAWQLDLHRKFIRHSGHLEKLHQFLIAETESGFISRQEAVSMIPPLLMDIKPHHKVLDMCAAPGSKTAQLLEMLHADESSPIPEGFVVANDVDFKRCYLLIHQLQRLASPCFAVVNHDASRIPNFKVDDDETSKFSVQFDRILADVPCTGDGTMRKNKDVWQKWNPINGTNLHGVQKRILRRGVELLGVGGRIVYSTCSLNPIEDEAVVAHVLKECKGSVELIDVSDELPHLKYKPGVSTWKVMTKQGEVYEKLEEVPDRLSTIILPSLFPPDEETAKKLNLNKCMRLLPHLQNTGGFFVAVMKKVKQLPWLPDRGDPRSKRNKSKPSTDAGSSSATVSDNVAAANVTVAANEIEKTDESTGENANENENANANVDENAKEAAVAWTYDVNPSAANVDASENGSEKEKTTAKASESGENEGNDNSMETSTTEESEKTSNGAGKRKAEESSRGGRLPKKPKYRGNKEDPFIYLLPDDKFWPPIKDFYGMKDEFPVDQLMIRCEDGKRRNIYFTNKAIKDIVTLNEDRIKFVNLGMKVLSRCDSVFSHCDFRLVQDGVHMMNHFVTRRIIDIPADDIIVLLSQENPFCAKFSDDTALALEALDQGGCLFRYKPDGEEGHPACEMVLCGWKAKVSARSFMPKQGRYHYLSLCGHVMHLSNKQSRNVGSGGSNNQNDSENAGSREALVIRPQSQDEDDEIKPDPDQPCCDLVKTEVKTEIKEEIKTETTEAAPE